MTYLNRTQPEAAAAVVLTTVQLDVLKAKSDKLPKMLTVAWAVEAVARLGGYLSQDAKNTNWHSGTLERLAEIGISV